MRGPAYIFTVYLYLQSIPVAATRATTIAANTPTFCCILSHPFCCAAVAEAASPSALKIVPVNVWPLIVVVTVAPNDRLALPLVVADTLGGNVALVSDGSVPFEQLPLSNPDQLTTQPSQLSVKVVREQ